MPCELSSVLRSSLYTQAMTSNVNPCMYELILHLKRSVIVLCFSFNLYLSSLQACHYSANCGKGFNSEHALGKSALALDYNPGKRITAYGGRGRTLTCRVKGLSLWVYPDWPRPQALETGKTSQSINLHQISARMYRIPRWNAFKMQYTQYDL